MQHPGTIVMVYIRDRCKPVCQGVIVVSCDIWEKEGSDNVLYYGIVNNYDHLESFGSRCVTYG